MLEDGVDCRGEGFQDNKEDRVVADWGADECEGRPPKCHFKDEVENRHGDGPIRLLQMVDEATLKLIAQV